MKLERALQERYKSALSVYDMYRFPWLLHPEVLPVLGRIVRVRIVVREELAVVDVQEGVFLVREQVDNDSVSHAFLGDLDVLIGIPAG